MMQLTTERAMRGRVMALHRHRDGRHADRRADRRLGRRQFGPRWALGVGALAGFAAAGVAVAYLVRYRHLRLFRDAGRLRLVIHPEQWTWWPFAWRPGSA